MSPTTTAAFTDYAARLANEPESWLGLVTWYSVADTRVQHDKLEKMLTDLGLVSWVPRRPADVDVFRRVCTAAQVKRAPTPDDGVFVNVLVRDVDSNGDEEILKRIVIETVDPKGRVLTFQEVYDLTFSRATSYVDVKRIGNIHSPAADAVAMTIRQAFKDEKGCVNGNAIRDLINRALVDSDATVLRPTGGVYFVMRAKAEIVTALETFAGLIEGTNVHSIPLPDDLKQRDMLRQSFEDEAVAEVDRTIAEIAKILKSGEKITAARFGEMAQRYKSLTDKAGKYSELLQTQLGSSTAALSMLDAQIGQLAGQLRAA